VVVGLSHHSRFFGGVSDDVADHAGCDVLLVHQRKTGIRRTRIPVARTSPERGLFEAAIATTAERARAS
jgi:hypothetical protein